MRKIIAIPLIGTALIAAPAFAQLGGVVGSTANVGANVGAAVNTTVDPASTVQHTTDHVGHAVNRANNAVQRRIDHAQLRVANTTDLSTGLTVRDSENRSVGTVQKVQGDTAIVVGGSKVYNIPVSQLYAKSAGKVNQVMTAVPRSSLQLAAGANANASASGKAAAGN